MASSKTCSRCPNPVRPTRNNNARYCQECHDAAPRNTGRKDAKMAEIIAHVDLEGRPHPTRTVQVKVHGQPVTMPQTVLCSASIGFEDGASMSLWSDDPREIMRWIVDQLGDTVGHGGRKIVAQGFHFGWDSAMLARDFDPEDMQLIHKVQTKADRLTRICGRTYHDPDEVCLMPHRYDPEWNTLVITEGGEGDLISWDQKSELAFAITPRRRMYIERRPEGDRYERWKRVDIHDVGAAFPPPNSLEQVISDWRPDISDEQRAAIAWGKAARHGGFVDGTPEQIMAYSEAECVAAAKSSRKLLDMVKTTTGIEIPPRKMFGAGSIAYQVFEANGVPKLRDTHAGGGSLAGIPINLLPVLDYFGGLIDAPIVGRIAGALDQEDINSAYPSKMATMPCMRSNHGRWDKRKGEPGPGLVGHVVASWDWTEHATSTAPFDVRLKDGSVRTPLSGYKIVVSLARYRAAKEQYPGDTMAHESAVWVQTCQCEPPFAWILDLYEQRLRIKAEMKGVPKGSPEWHELNMQQLAVKLILNSGYGKLAQTRPEPGPYTNLHYASFITGATRATVASEAWRLEATGGTVAYQHTDSELFVGGDKLDDTKALGGWGQEAPTVDQLLVQPGLAFSLAAELDDKGKPTSGKTATRGCDAAKFVAAAHQWAETTDFTLHPFEWPPLVVEQDRMVSRRLAVFQGHPERAGCFLPHNLAIRVVSTKRAFYNARPMPGHPEAWVIPPHDTIPSEFIATLEDIRIYQSQLAKRLAQGLVDGGVDLDEWLTG